MKKRNCLIPHEKIFRTILFLRGQKVMLDADLAGLYGVSTKRLNEQVRRNSGRFPSDFMFRLTPEEKKLIVNSLSFNDELVKTVMTPRDSINSIKKSEFCI